MVSCVFMMCLDSSEPGVGIEGKSVSDSGRSGFLFCSLVSLLTEI